MLAVQLVETGRRLEERQVEEKGPGRGDVTVRVTAAGVCHSDAHYRAGYPVVGPLPLTLGHEVAGRIEQLGEGVSGIDTGTRVCLHYQLSCGHCRFCRSGFEQFCRTGRMLGNSVDGGYAELITVPARNTFPIPDGVTDEHAAVMMCSSATALHALRKGRLLPGERVAVFGAGGLGQSAVQLAIALGASEVFAVDVDPGRLDLAASFGAVPVDGKDPVAELRRLAGGEGVDVALELVGATTVMRNALDSLTPMGRAVAVGLTDETMPIGPYADLVRGEAELIGASDHLASEIPELLDLAVRGRLNLGPIVTGTIPLDADAINAALDRLDRFGGGVRTVIRPGAD